jgi:DNA-binding NarL/FixJ family response regulator
MPMITSPPSPAGTTLRVVVVDDSEDLVFLVRGAMERTGQFTVVAEAADGEQGVAAVTREQPDLVLLDILMPVMDGLAALPLIRAASPDSIVVMLSALGDSTGMPEKALALGANGYIHKDGRLQALPEQLRVIVGGALAERTARRAREDALPPSPRIDG